jgi:hypothetical protein
MALNQSVDHSDTANYALNCIYGKVSCDVIIIKVHNLTYSDIVHYVVLFCFVYTRPAGAAWLTFSSF